MFFSTSLRLMLSCCLLAFFGSAFDFGGGFDDLIDASDFPLDDIPVRHAQSIDDDSDVLDMQHTLLQHNLELFQASSDELQRDVEDAPRQANVHDRKSEILKELDEFKDSEREVRSAIESIDGSFEEDEEDVSHATMSLLQNKFDLSRANLKRDAIKALRMSKLLHRKADVLTELSLVEELDSIKEREAEVAAAIDEIEAQKKRETEAAQQESVQSVEEEEIDQVHVGLLQKSFETRRKGTDPESLLRSAEESKSKADLLHRKADVLNELSLMQELKELRKREEELEEAIEDIESHSVKDEEQVEELDDEGDVVVIRNGVTVLN